MNMRHFIRIAVVFAGFLAQRPAWAQCDREGFSVMPISFGTGPVAVGALPELYWGGTVVAEPVHGQLSRLPGGGFAYTAAASFWTAGTDRLSVASPSGSAVYTVRLLAPSARSRETFEEAESAPRAGGEWALVGRFAEALFEPAAALSGVNGMWVVDSPSQDIYLRTHLDLLEGYGDAGAGAEGGWKPPGMGGGHRSPCAPPECTLPESSARILDLLFANGESVGLRMKTGASGVELRLEAGPTHRGSWLPVTQQPHQLILLAWDPAGSEPGGAAFYLDGELAASFSLGFVPRILSAPEVRFGTFEAESDIPGHGWDHLTAFSFTGKAARARCLRQESFDDPTLGSQWEVLGGENLEIVAPISDSGGALQVEPAGAGSPPGGVVSASSLMPLAIHRLGLRFGLDTQQLVLPPQSTVLLADAANNRWSRSFRLLIDPKPGGLGYQLRLQARENDPALPPLAATVALPPGSRHTLEIDWLRSPTEVVGTGTLRLFIDGQEAAELTGLLTSEQTLMDVRVGGIAVVGSPSGKLLLDDVEMWYEP